MTGVPALSSALRAERAKMLMQDEVLLEIFQQIDDDAVFRWRNGTTPAEREEAHAHQKALAAVRDQIRVRAENLEYERKEAERRERNRRTL